MIAEVSALAQSTTSWSTSAPARSPTRSYPSAASSASATVTTPCLGKASATTPARVGRGRPRQGQPGGRAELRAERQPGLGRPRLWAADRRFLWPISRPLKGRGRSDRGAAHGQCRDDAAAIAGAAAGERETDASAAGVRAAFPGLGQACGQGGDRHRRRQRDRPDGVGPVRPRGRQRRDRLQGRARGC